VSIALTRLETTLLSSVLTLAALMGVVLTAILIVLWGPYAGLLMVVLPLLILAFIGVEYLTGFPVLGADTRPEALEASSNGTTGFVVKVDEKHSVIIERFGKYWATLEAGLHFIPIPGVYRVRYNISLADRTTPINNQPIISREGPTILINSEVVWRVVSYSDLEEEMWRQFDEEYLPIEDPVKRAAYGIANLIGESDNEPAVLDLVSSILRSYSGKTNFEELQNSMDAINKYIWYEANKKTLRDWGIYVDKHLIKEVIPPESMKRAMEAELTAKKEAAAAVAQSEGELKVRTNKAEADLIERKKRAEGNAYDQEQEGVGVSKKVAALAKAFSENGASGQEGTRMASNLYLEERRIEEMSPAIGRAGSVIVVPADVAGITGFAKAAQSIFEAGRPPITPPPPPTRGGKGNDPTPTPNPAPSPAPTPDPPAPKPPGPSQL
jgi:regulator of protease activity HflC (stomatin/prohibitin superfamily)